MGELFYRYHFEFESGISKEIEVLVDKESMQLSSVNKAGSDWTKLECCKCSICPLEDKEYCPAALALENIVDQFSDITSIEEMDVRVETQERVYLKRCNAQNALQSLIGLVMPVSGCPVTRYFAPMARFHLPFSSEEETLYRCCATQFLHGYFNDQGGVEGESRSPTANTLDELKEVYQNMHIVNTGIAARIRTTSQSDSTSNAIVLLDCFTKSVPYFINKSLDNLAYCFFDYGEKKGLNSRAK